MKKSTLVSNLIGDSNSMTSIIEWHDLIKGKVKFDPKNLSDPILIREDGSLLYHLPSVIDDIEEGISHIIRERIIFQTLLFIFKYLKP